MQPAQNPYSILNVSPDADPVVIEAAYKALMKKYHPDRMEPGAADLKRAAQINEAFAILKDPQKRADCALRHAPPERVFVPPVVRPVPPSMKLRVAALSGWVAAAAFGGALALTVQAREKQIYAYDRIAAADEPAEVVPKRATAAEVLAATEAAKEDLLGLGGPAVTSAPIVAVPAMVTAPAVAVALQEPPVEIKRPKARAMAQVSKPKPQPKKTAPARARTRQDGDFLEREGYIY